MGYLRLIDVQTELQTARNERQASKTELLAVQAELKGLRHDSVAVHMRDLNELPTQLLAVRDDVGTLRDGR